MSAGPGASDLSSLQCDQSPQLEAGLDMTGSEGLSAGLQMALPRASTVTPDTQQPCTICG